jgi:hypothetical protein
MSEQVPDIMITVEADTRAESTTVLVRTQPLFTPQDRPLYARVLARGGVHAPDSDVSAARHGRLAARLRLLRCPGPVGAALSGARRRRHGQVSGPPTPTLTFSLVGG